MSKGNANGTGPQRFRKRPRILQGAAEMNAPAWHRSATTYGSVRNEPEQLHALCGYVVRDLYDIVFEVQWSRAITPSTTPKTAPCKKCERVAQEVPDYLEHYDPEAFAAKKKPDRPAHRGAQRRGNRAVFGSLTPESDKRELAIHEHLGSDIAKVVAGTTRIDFAPDQSELVVTWQATSGRLPAAEFSAMEARFHQMHEAGERQ